MEPEPQNKKTNATRKIKYAPKAPRQPPKLEVKTEVVEDANTVQAKDLLRRFTENSVKAKPKVERKVAPSQVAFGYGGQSISVKSYGIPKGGSTSKTSAFDGGARIPGWREEKEYKEPWDYFSYYPVILPMRRPYSGNPEHLDGEEFGEASEITSYDEDSTNAAVHLGLMEENQEQSMIFLQLPPAMPITKRSATEDGHEQTNSSRPRRDGRAKGKTCALDELPAGFMGKMLVYKSGAVKLKLGNILYDVGPGLDCVFAQDVVAVNTTEKHCCLVGELKKRAILTPDLDSILSSMADL
ncbi:RNA_pol_Rpc4 domain-containing protein [Cephalotus follicularis]|uniref:RNA_pol_Rpc4 domain-containing protein n=1 Tax=Cephalotus follicularis TaxID=3775 RepID=A0A1Q3BY25_CEPFO|nr:RNA_pol_Rpc4 domain-containing protein [Cephalotus follicularis]